MLYFVVLATNHPKSTRKICNGWVMRALQTLWAFALLGPNCKANRKSQKGCTIHASICASVWCNRGEQHTKIHCQRMKMTLQELKQGWHLPFHVNVCPLSFEASMIFCGRSPTKKSHQPNAHAWWKLNRFGRKPIKPIKPPHRISLHTPCHIYMYRNVTANGATKHTGNM